MKTGDFDVLAAKYVLVSMECSRLSSQVSQMHSTAQKQATLIRERDVLKAQVDTLRRSEFLRVETEAANLKLTKELISLQEVNRLKDDKIRRMEADIKVYQLKADGSQSRQPHSDGIFKRIEELRSENLELSRLAGEHRSMMQEIATLKVDNARLERILDESKKQIPESQMQKNHFSDLQVRVTTLEEENTQLRKRLRELLDRETEHIQRNQTLIELQDKVRKLISDTEEKQIRINSLSSENQDLKRHASRSIELEESVRKLLEENQRITDVLLEVRQQVQTTGSTDLKISNSELRMQLESSKSEVDRLSRTNKELQERLRSLQNSYAARSAEASQMDLVIAENERLATTMLELKKKHLLVVKERDELASNYQKSSVREKESLNEIKTKLVAAEDSSKHLQLLLDQANSKILNLQKDLDQYLNKDRNLAQVEEALRREQLEKESLRRINEDLKAFNSIASEELNQLRSSNSKLASLEKTHKLLSEENTGNRQIIESLEKKVFALEQQISHRDFELEKTRKEVTKSAEQYKDKYTLQAEVDKYRRLYLDSEEKNKQLDELQNKLSIALEEKRLLQEANLHLQEQAQAESERSHHSRESALTSEEAIKLKVLIQKLDTELAVLRKKEAESEAHIQDLSSRLHATNNAEGELRVCAEQLRATRKEEERLARENRNLNLRLVEERNLTAKLKIENEAHQRSLSTNIQRIENDYEEMLTDLKRKLETADLDRLEATQRLETLVASLQRENTRMKVSEDLTRDELTDTKLKLVEEQETSKRLARDNEDMKRLITELERSRFDTDNLKSEDLVTQSAGLKLTEVERRNAILEEQISHQATQIADLVKLIEELRDRNTLLTTSNESIPRLEVQVSTLQEKVSTYAKTIEDLKGQKESVLNDTEELMATERRIEKNANSRIEELLQRVAALETDKLSLQKTLSANQVQIQNQRQELLATNELYEEIKKLSQKNIDLIEQNTQLQTDLSRLKVSAQKTEQENGQYIIKLNETLEQLSRIPALDRDVSSKKDEIRLLKQQQTQLASELDACRKLAADLEARNQELNTASAGLVHQKLEQLEQVIRQIDLEKQTITEDFETHKRAADQDKRESQQLISELTAKVRRLQSAQPQPQPPTRSEISQAAGEELVAQIEVYRRNVASLETRLQEYREQLDQLTQDLDSRTAELQAQRSGAQASRDADQRELAKLREKYDLAKQERNDLRSRQGRQEEDLLSSSATILALKAQVASCLAQLPKTDSAAATPREGERR